MLKKLKASSEYRKSIRQEVYYCKKFGVGEHIKSCGAGISEDSYLKSLLGRVNYVLSIDSTNEEMKKYKAWILKQFKKI